MASSRERVPFPVNGDDEAVREYGRQLAMDGLLEDALGDKAVVDARAKTKSTASGGPLPDAAESRRGAPRGRRRVRSRPLSPISFRNKKIRYGLALAAAAAILTVAYLYPSRVPEPDQRSRSLEIVRIEGQAQLLTAAGKRTLRVGDSVRPGNGIETGREAGVHARYPDGSTLEMAADTGLRVAEHPGGKALRFKRGAVYVDLKPQPENRSLILNPGARDQALVLGTAFEMQRDTGKTTLRVEKGAVRFGQGTDAVVCRKLQQSVVPDTGKPTQPVAIKADEIGAWRTGVRKRSASVSGLPLHPYKYEQDFEHEDPFEVYSKDGSYTIHFKGLSAEHSASGRKSFKIDVTLDTASYLYFQIPIKIPCQGRLRFSGKIRATISGHEARAALGIGTILLPCPLGGTRAAYPYQMGTGTRWVTEGIDDLVAMGRIKVGRLLEEHCAEAKPEDVGVWIGNITLYLQKGTPGCRYTVFVDDIELEGEIPDPDAYLAMRTPPWEAYKARMNAEIKRLTSDIDSFDAPLVYPPDVAFLADIKRKAKVVKNSIAKRTFSKPRMLEDLQRAHESLPFLKSRSEHIKARAGKGIVQYTRDPMTPGCVLPGQPVPAEPSNTAALRACPGEYEATSLIVHATTELKEVSVKVGDLLSTGGARIPADRIDVRLVKCWYQAGRMGLLQKNRRVLVPELLLKDDGLVRVDGGQQKNQLRVTRAGRTEYVDISAADAGFPENAVFDDAGTLQPFNVPLHENKELWVTVHVPEGAAPGRYSGKTTLAPANAPSAEFTIVLDVLPFRLKPPLLTCALYYLGSLPNGEAKGVGPRDKTEAQYRREMENMKAHGVPYPTLFYRAWNRVPDMLRIRRDTGFPNDLIYLMKEAGTSQTAADIARMKGGIRIWLEAIRKYGYRDVYFHGGRELSGPMLTQRRAAWKAVHELGGRVFAGCGADAPGLVGDLLDLPIVSDVLPEPEPVAAWRARGKSVFTHATPVGVEDPLLYRRAYGPQLWLKGFDGSMAWAYQLARGHIWNDFDHRTHRDYVFAYPTSNGLVDTVQWEGYREAVDDLRYLATLHALGARTDQQLRDWLGALISNGLTPSEVRAEIIQAIRKTMGR